MTDLYKLRVSKINDYTNNNYNTSWIHVKKEMKLGQKSFLKNSLDEGIFNVEKQ